jgi:hypothetical protein
MSHSLGSDRRLDIAAATKLAKSLKVIRHSRPHETPTIKGADMKRIRLLGLTLIALIALGAFASANAFAELPEILPVPTAANPAKFTSEAPTEAKLITTKDNEVKCKKAKNKGEFTSQDAGTVLIEFEGCEAFSLPCNSEGDKAGVILLKGAMQLVDVLPTGTLDLGIWIEPKNAAGTKDLSFTCGGIFTITVLGSVIGVIDNAKGELLTTGTKAKEFKALWKQAKLGEQEIKECMSLKALCEKGPFELKADVGEGEELAAEIADATLIFEKEISVDF